MNYRKAYAILVGVISSAIDELALSQEIEPVIQRLTAALEETEEMYIDSKQ